MNSVHQSCKSSCDASHRRANQSKRVVKNWLALICAIPIRSLRTKWSRMENKGLAVLLLYLGRVSAMVGLVRHRRARTDDGDSGQACIATDQPVDGRGRDAREAQS